MKTAAIGIVIENHHVLLVNRRFPPQLWAPPGGFLDPDETPEETIQRETWEETGITCKVVSKIHEFHYNQSHILVYACQYVSGDLQCSYESLDVGWFPLDNLPTPISPDISVFKKAAALLDSAL